MNQEIDYRSKYLKYKIKYIDLKLELDGGKGTRSSGKSGYALAADIGKAQKKREKEEAKEMKREMKRERKEQAKEQKHIREAVKYFDKKVLEIESEPRGWKSSTERKKFERAWELIEGGERFEGEEDERKEKYLKILEIVKKYSKE